MTLGDLKKSLTRFGSGDLDDRDIIIIFEKDGKLDYDLLVYTAYVTVADDDIPCVVLGSMRAAIKQNKDGNLTYSDGTKPEDDDFNPSTE